MSESAKSSPRFFQRLAETLNAGLARSVILAGEIHDLFYAEGGGAGGATGAESGGYVPLMPYLCRRCSVPGMIVLAYEINGPVRVYDAAASGTMGGRGGHALPRWGKLRDAWVSWKLGTHPDQLVLRSLTDRQVQLQRETAGAEFDRYVQDVIGQPTFAFEFLRQLTQCSRSLDPTGRPYLSEQLLVLVESADMLLPAGNGDLSALPHADRHRIAIVQDWFADPDFVEGGDSVVLLAESAAQIHPRIARLPTTLTLEVEPPSVDDRSALIHRFLGTAAGGGKPGGGGPTLPEDATAGRAVPRVELWSSPEAVAAAAAGMSLHALRQMLRAAAHRREPVTPDAVIDQVESYIGRQLGEDVIEFKRPTHTLDQVVGASGLKGFLRSELIPRFRAHGDEALPGAAVAGPIGGGKTFIFEALAAELDLPVLVLKNIRSQWFGQTDVVFERLRRVLGSLGKVLIFVDEADTQFGGVGPDAHATERRLTGKVQQMMSDPALRGRVIWLLMTARIHRLSPDIRRPGRVGDLIIPVLDAPRGSEDRRAFIRWTLEPVLEQALDEATLARFDASISATSAAAFAALRSRLKAEVALAGGQKLSPDAVERLAHDQLLPAIAPVRRYQTLQALLNCTRRSLLPDPEVDEAQRLAWRAEIGELEARGVG